MGRERTLRRARPLPGAAQLAQRQAVGERCVQGFTVEFGGSNFRVGERTCGGR